ncbi:MAG: TipAS antibiotic-recognition domain-containing protein, partial [Clostridium sp.]
DDIKKRLMPVESPKDVVTLLTNQTTIIKEQISKSEKLLESIEMLKVEINNTNNVDWSKYSNMLKLIGENNEYYWVIKHLDKDILDSIIERHETYGDEDINVGWWKSCFEKCIELQKSGKTPECKEAQELASIWWQVVIKYSKGDFKLIGKLVKFYKSADQWPEEFREIQKQAEGFMEKAIEIYLTNNNISLEI